MAYEIFRGEDSVHIRGSSEEMAELERFLKSEGLKFTKRSFSINPPPPPGMLGWGIPTVIEICLVIQTLIKLDGWRQNGKISAPLGKLIKELVKLVKRILGQTAVGKPAKTRRGKKKK